MADSEKKLLIIDDEKDLCDLLKERFEEDEGFKVSVAYNGREGLLKAIHEIPQCIVLDIRMPVDDGLSILRQLRSYRDEDPERQARIRAIPVIVLSGMAGKLKPLFQVEGVHAFLEKPYDAEDLCRHVLNAAYAGL